MCFLVVLWRCYVPEVHFEYEVDGRFHQGKRVSFESEPSFPSRAKAEGFLEVYPPGSAVDVYYNPDQPDESVLSQNMRRTSASLIVGILLIVLMLCFLCPIFTVLINTYLSIY